MTEVNLVDTELLQGYLDNLGVAVVEKMLALYLDQSILYLDNIADALAENDHGNWHEHCHKMKGAAGSVGLLQVHKFLVSIEKSTAPETKKAEYLTQLKLINKQSIEAFQLWLSKVS